MYIRKVKPNAPHASRVGQLAARAYKRRAFKDFRIGTRMHDRRTPRAAITFQFAHELFARINGNNAQYGHSFRHISSSLFTFRAPHNDSRFRWAAEKWKFAEEYYKLWFQLPSQLIVLRPIVNAICSRHLRPKHIDRSTSPLLPPRRVQLIFSCLEISPLSSTHIYRHFKRYMIAFNIHDDFSSSTFWMCKCLALVSPLSCTT